jgi:hypothetical protein
MNLKVKGLRYRPGALLISTGRNFFNRLFISIKDLNVVNVLR